jgi:protoporphyrinogen oxidase
MTTDRIVILGAGPAGLAAGYELCRRGASPVILERTGAVGGISRTEVYKDYCFDIGGHRFFTGIKRVDDMWRQLMSADLLTVRRKSRIYYRGRLFDYPLSFWNSLSNLGPVEGSLILASYIKARLRPLPCEDTFEQWVTNRFGDRLYRMFFKEYTEKVWGIPCTEIQADWAAQRIQGLSLVSAIKNAVLGNGDARTLIGQFHYPLKGPGMMWERFQEEITRLGGEVRLNAKVVGLRHEKSRAVSVICSGSDDNMEVPVDHLVSSIPVGRLVTCLEPEAPAHVIEAAHGLKHRAFILVGLVVERQELFPDQWIYVHSPQVRVARIQNFKNWSAAMVPDSGKSTLGMEYICSEGDDVWTMSDSALKEMASRELAELGLACAADVSDSHVIRQPDAYPVYDEGYRERLGVLRAFLEGFENIQSIGRNGMHRYNNMDHSMYTGMLAAENALGGHHDVWDVNGGDTYLG